MYSLEILHLYCCQYKVKDERWYSVKYIFISKSVKKSSIKVYTYCEKNNILCEKIISFAHSHYCRIILCIAKPNVIDSLRSITYIDLLIKLASYSIDNDFEGWINKNIQSD